MDICNLEGEYFYYREPIGFGSFSIIYKGYMTNNQTPIAIKKITKIIDIKYLNNEVKLMKSINHPNILKLYDVVIKNRDEIYLILEYCNNGDLCKYIQSGENKNDNSYFTQILYGLEYLYNHNILHRDIKPQNILINNNTIKISDFGFAKTFEKNELITTFCGSPLYMAPEIFKNRQYDLKSDIWSLGVILYELLAKKHPYNVNNKGELLKIIDLGPDINWNHINIKYREFLKKLLQPNPTNRIKWSELFIEFKIMNNELEDIDNDILFHDIEYNYSIDFNDIDDSEDVLNLSVISNNSQDNTKILSKSINNSRNNIICEQSINISKSAPTNLGNSLLSNYINNKTREVSSDNLAILGTSPNIKNTGLGSYLDKSVKTLKNFFNFK